MRASHNWFMIFSLVSLRLLQLSVNRDSSVAGARCPRDVRESPHNAAPLSFILLHNGVQIWKHHFGRFRRSMDLKAICSCQTPPLLSSGSLKSPQAKKCFGERSDLKVELSMVHGP